MNPIESFRKAQLAKKPPNSIETIDTTQTLPILPDSSITTNRSLDQDGGVFTRDPNVEDHMIVEKEDTPQSIIESELERNKGDTDNKGNKATDLRTRSLELYKSFQNMFNLVAKKEFVPITQIPIEDVEAVALEYAFREIQNLGIVSKSDYLLIRSIVDSILQDSQISQLPNSACFANPLLISFFVQPSSSSSNESPAEQSGSITSSDLVDTIKLKAYVKSKLKEAVEAKLNPTEGVIANKNEALKIESYSSCSQGIRKTMEDQHIVITDLNSLMGLNTLQKSEVKYNYSFFGVYDGHMGKLTSEYCRARLHVNLVRDSNFLSGDCEGIKRSIHNAYVNTSKSFNSFAKRENIGSCGTTSVTILLRDDFIFVANAGDSEAVLCTKDGKATVISDSHLPGKEEEKERITKSGGAVVWFGNWRVNGLLSVSRSIGDYSLENIVIADPYMNQIPRSPDQDFIILATDGLWDVMKHQEACDFVRNFINENDEQIPQEKLAERKLIRRKEVANEMVEEAKRRKSTDNISVLLIFFVD